MSGGHAGQRKNPARAAPEAATGPGVSPALLGRFRALIDEVTDELMQGRSGDRNSFRADAIALLIATNGHIDGPSDAVESPLTYLLREEQQKAAAALGDDGSMLTFMKV